MMKRATNLLPILIACLTAAIFSRCVTEDDFDNTPSGNFEALWHLLDEHYCFFQEKADTYGLDWNTVHEKYRQFFTPSMTGEQLFEVCARMIRELRDGHVNLTSSFNVARYWDWFEQYPSNFSDSLLRKYLGTSYMLSAGMKYRILEDNIGYIYCGSFDQNIGSGNLNAIFTKLAICDGLIIDVRNNDGGLLSSAQSLAGCFTNQEITAGYMAHKTGPAHNAISSLKPVKLKPAEGMRWQKRAVVLTNRSTFSAANAFAMYARACPKVILMGAKSGGGAGMPFHAELPNGWSLRFSACPMYDSNKQSAEEGIEPDIAVNMTAEDLIVGRDNIIETARAYLRQ
jgi:hypothetical protein